MKKIILSMFFFTLVFSALAQAPGSTLYVAAKAVDLKSTTGFFARTLGTISLGDPVIVMQSSGKWLAVRSPYGLQGWAPSDAFSARFILRSGAETSVTEFPLAGKGFTGDLEQIMKTTGAANYSGIDAMENRTVPSNELRSFLVEGRLAEGE